MPRAIIRALCLGAASCTLDPTSVMDGRLDADIDGVADVGMDAPGPHPFTVGIQADAPWPLLGGTSGRLGRSKAIGPSTSHVRWKYNLGAPILYASPVIDNTGTIYIGATNGRFVALDPTGALKWKIDFATAIEATAVIAKDGTIFIGANDATLSAISPNGKVLRNATANGSIRGGMTIDGDGVVYFSQAAMGGGEWRPDGTLYYSAATGDAAIAAGILCGLYCWRSAPIDMKASFTLAPNLSVRALEEYGSGFGVGPGNVVAFQSDGSVRWATRGPDSGPIYVTTSMFGVSADGDVTVYADDMLHFTRGGVLDWNYPISADPYPRPVVTAPIVDAADTSYFGVNDGRILALDSHGAVSWSIDTRSRASEAFAMGADGTLYFGLGDGFIYAIGP